MSFSFSRLPFTSHDELVRFTTHAFTPANLQTYGHVLVINNRSSHFPYQLTPKNTAATIFNAVFGTRAPDTVPASALVRVTLLTSSASLPDSYFHLPFVSTKLYIVLTFKESRMVNVCPTHYSHQVSAPLVRNVPDAVCPRCDFVSGSFDHSKDVDSDDEEEASTSSALVPFRHRRRSIDDTLISMDPIPLPPIFTSVSTTSSALAQTLPVGVDSSAVVSLPSNLSSWVLSHAAPVGPVTSVLSRGIFARFTRDPTAFFTPSQTPVHLSPPQTPLTPQPVYAFENLLSAPLQALISNLSSDQALFPMGTTSAFAISFATLRAIRCVAYYHSTGRSPWDNSYSLVIRCPCGRRVHEDVDPLTSAPFLYLHDVQKVFVQFRTQVLAIAATHSERTPIDSTAAFFLSHFSISSTQAHFTDPFFNVLIPRSQAAVASYIELLQSFFRSLSRPQVPVSGPAISMNIPYKLIGFLSIVFIFVVAMLSLTFKLVMALSPPAPVAPSPITVHSRNLSKRDFVPLPHSSAQLNSVVTVTFPIILPSFSFQVDFGSNAYFLLIFSGVLSSITAFFLFCFIFSRIIWMFVSIFQFIRSCFSRKTKTTTQPPYLLVE